MVGSSFAPHSSKSPESEKPVTDVPIHFINQVGGVLTLTLHRPDKFNSFHRAMAFELQDYLDQAQEDESVRCVVLTGSGRAFCAGQDLAEVVDPEGPKLTTILQEHYNPIVVRLRELQKPVIAAVNGVAAGAGANIALCCDIVVAKESASFIQAFSKIGLIQNSGGTWILPRLVGFQRASALMMTGDKVSAADALAMGMLYNVFADDAFDSEVEKLAKQMAAMPTQGLWLTKQALNDSCFYGFEDQLLTEEALQTAAGRTSDYAEGVAAFLEKRKPVLLANNPIFLCFAATKYVF
jgi:2-(1,2-epoxy-1,2-dihydrophenyl)acetyl-CoA isomerase